MNLFDLLKVLNPTVSPADSKIHLATWNGVENPLDVYYAGNFQEWQRWQNKRNFERPLVIALVALEAANEWLFCGVFKSSGCTLKDGSCYYDLDEVANCSELSGRTVVHFSRPGRNSYLNGDRWSERMIVKQILEEPLQVSEFPGYRGINLSKETLETIIRKAVPGWKAALSSVAGVYIITDAKTGALYVGSANGEGGIWQRWLEYATNGHGGNDRLRALIRNEGVERSSFFRFSILEIADIHESKEQILARESHWKSVLLSREHGLNAN